jgi:uncharacterized protein
MQEDDLLPDREEAFELLKKLKVPYQVRRHSLRVAEKALDIARKLKNVKVNEDLVEIGSILHDIGRSRTHGFKHAIIGGDILKERGFPPALVRICETHILGGLDEIDAKELDLPIKNYIPESLEEKIICLADKQFAGTKEVSIEQRFDKWFNKYGKTEILLKAKARIEKMQKEIMSLE